MTIKSFNIVPELLGVCFVFVFPHCFSLCGSASVFPLHLDLGSLVPTSAVLNLVMSWTNLFLIHFTRFVVFFFISSISTWSFYSSISLLKIPFSLCMLSTFCSKCFKILNLVVLKSSSDSFNIWITCKYSPIDCIFPWQQVGECVFVPVSCTFLYYWIPDILWRGWGKKNLCLKMGLPLYLIRLWVLGVEFM